MILLAMLLATQSDLVAKADQANYDYTACLSAQSREAHAARLSLADFKRKLANACIAEERQMQNLMTRVLTQRGEANAASTAKKSTRDSRAGVLRTYESLPEIERQFEKLAEVCRQRPKACE